MNKNPLSRVEAIANRLKAIAIRVNKNSLIGVTGDKFDGARLTFENSLSWIGGDAVERAGNVSGESMPKAEQTFESVVMKRDAQRVGPFQT